MLCGGVAACRKYGVCTVRCVGCDSQFIKFNKECVSLCVNVIQISH